MIIKSNKMSYESRICEIKKDPKYLKLKNKTRTNQENQQFQKFLREIKWNELQLEEKPAAVVAPAPVEVAPKKRSAWRNQPKPIAWRNQNKTGVVNNDVIDVEYEKEYRARLEKFKITGQFSGNIANGEVGEVCEVCEVGEVGVGSEIEEVCEVEEVCEEVCEITPPPSPSPPPSPVKKVKKRGRKKKVVKKSDDELEELPL